MTTEAHDPRQLAAVAAASTFVWYAMPDVVRSRGARVLLKTVVAAAVGVWAGTIIREHGDQLDEVVSNFPKSDELNANQSTLIGGVVLASLGLTIAAEKAIFAFGERRRARGVRLAHTAPAIGLAGLVAAVAAADDYS